MADTSIIRTTKDIVEDINNSVSRLNEAMAIADKAERTTKVSAESETLAKLETEYAKTAEYEKIKALSEMDKPMLEAIKNPSYIIIRHRDVKDEVTKLVTSVEAVQVSRDIDLLRLDAFTKYTASHIKGWEHYVSKFNSLVVLRCTRELGLKIPEVRKTYYLNQKAKEIEMGGTPTSNTQMLKQLQSVIDAIVFEDNGKGGNKYKATSHDVEFVLESCTKMGRKHCQIIVSKDAYLRKIMLNVLINVVTGCGYSIDGYKKVN